MSQTGDAAGATTALPDINAETYPFDVVQHLLDEAAYFSLYALPQPGSPAGGHDAGAGFCLREVLHRAQFDVEVSAAGGVRARNRVAEPIARHECLWSFAPEDFAASPGKPPPLTPFDPSRSQRFVMLDDAFTFGSGSEGFRGFGEGRTFPARRGGRGLSVGAVGSLLEGTGRFRGLEGTYTCNGTLAPGTGFQGSIYCRVMDPRGVLRSERSLPEAHAALDPEPQSTYLTFRGQKTRAQKTFYTYGPDGRVSGIQLAPQIRCFHADCAIDGRGRLLSSVSVGQVVGRMDAWIFFDVFDSGPGTPDQPVKFRDYDEYVFLDAQGNRLGGFGADGGGAALLGFPFASQPGGGLSFKLALAGAPAQPALRFGGFGPVLSGKLQLAEAEGMMMHNSAVGLFPHVLSTLFVVRLADPERRLRSGGGHCA